MYNTAEQQQHQPKKKMLYDDVMMVCIRWRLGSHIYRYRAMYIPTHGLHDVQYMHTHHYIHYIYIGVGWWASLWVGRH